MRITLTLAFILTILPPTMSHGYAPHRHIFTPLTKEQTSATRHQKFEILMRSIGKVVMCIAKEVTRVKRVAAVESNKNIAELITDAMKVCAEDARAMVGLYDQLYGHGGEEFLIGPFSDYLPEAVEKLLR